MLCSKEGTPQPFITWRVSYYNGVAGFESGTYESTLATARATFLERAYGIVAAQDHGEYEVNKELVLSTCHIPYGTSKALSDQTMTAADTNVPYGWRVWVDSDIIEGHKVLAGLLALAEEKGCKWLVLDQDGPVCDDITQWEW